MKYWHLLLLLIPQLASAGTVYRAFDSEGNAIYSDEPFPGSEPFRLPGITVLPAVQPEGAAQSESVKPIAQSQPVVVDYALRISKPEHDSTLRSDSGSVDVELELTPELTVGHTIHYRIDTQPPQRAVGVSFTISGLERGDHTLTVWIADQAGEQIGRQKSANINLLRGSALHHPVSTEGAGTGVQQAPRMPMAPQAPRLDLPKQYVPHAPHPTPPSPPPPASGGE